MAALALARPMIKPQLIARATLANNTEFFNAHRADNGLLQLGQPRRESVAMIYYHDAEVIVCESGLCYFTHVVDVGCTPAPGAAEALDIDEVQAAVTHHLVKLGLPLPTSFQGQSLARPARTFLLWETLDGWGKRARPLVEPMLLANLVFLLMAWRASAARAWRLRPNACEHCRYSLRGLPEDTTVCPECGKAIERSEPEQTG
ncbi:MAG: hypothetical protein KDA20_13420 [Phycisphaerales bacterium]|nr:hypothetical protein [Phycisphaerales bacterium]